MAESVAQKTELSVLELLPFGGKNSEAVKECAAKRVKKYANMVPTVNDVEMGHKTKSKNEPNEMAIFEN